MLELCHRSGLWCQTSLNLSALEAEQIDLYFDKILDGKGPSGECVKPCSFTRYSVDYLGMVKSEEWGGVYVDIDNIVDRKLTGWQVDAKERFRLLNILIE